MQIKLFTIPAAKSVQQPRKSKHNLRMRIRVCGAKRGLIRHLVIDPTFNI
jgi:ribosomal protein S14